MTVDERIAELALSLDFQAIARSARNAGGHLYREPAGVERRPARELVEMTVRLQHTATDADDPGDGGWSGGNPGEKFPDNWITNDEGTSAKALALLLLYEGNDVPGRGAAIRRALAYLRRTQFTPAGGVQLPRLSRAGVPGYWRMSAAPERSAFPEVYGERSQDDGCSEWPARVLALRAVRDGDQDARNRVLLAGGGMWHVCRQWNGGQPLYLGDFGEPIWGRGHQPPCLSPDAVASTLQVFCACYAVSGDRDWLDRADVCAEWLRATREGDAGWAYFLEPHTLRRVWGKRSHPRHLTYNEDEAHWPTSFPGSKTKNPIGPLTRLARIHALLR